MRWLSDRTVQHLRRVAEWPDLGQTKYRLLEELGRGGMGTVYLAEDTVLERRVALKVVVTAAARPGAAERMWNEARVLARLEHPGIVPVHDAGALPDGRIFYAMKRVDGRRLDELAPSLTLPERLRTLRRVCEAVAFAHDRGVVHRDLKPENVMVGAFGEVLVMDWGVAKALEGGPVPSLPEGIAVSPSDATADGTVIGTLEYMAPEQAEGAADRIGTPADVYALGGILYFLLTGHAPFEGPDAERRARGAARVEPRPPRRRDPSIAPALEAIVLRAMAVEPASRYAAAEDLSADLARFLDGDRSTRTTTV
ncbi:MAG TPA: serine/threonine-protein kinase [Thermoanaerobaculia bacterium]|jgi:serine/threonine protein kinase|nr:serine/threonine-protein kinase [Thermoanaerobaculia bacterium]